MKVTTVNMENITSKEVLATFESLKDGVVFETCEEMRTSIKKWCDTFFMPLVIFTNNTYNNWNKKKGKKGRITLKCPHGYKAVSTAKGTAKRKMQSLNFTGCPAIVNAKEQNDGTWVITKSITKHNGHMVGKTVYNTYSHLKRTSKEDLEYVAELANANVHNRIIAQLLSERTGRSFKTKDINNMIRYRKLRNVKDKGEKCLEKYLE